MSALVCNLQTKIIPAPELVALVTAALDSVLTWAGYPAAAQVSLALVDEAYIQELNHRYRQIDRPTDVLSFAMLEGEAPALPGEEILLGDIVISLPAAVSQAAEYGHSLEREVVYLALHGMLHLLGYDHEEEADRLIMREKEEEFLARLKLARV